MTYLQVESGEEILVNLVVDEMAIMKHLQFDGKKFVGAVDMGEENEKSDLAGESLTFMAVAINNNWKVPLGYFFIKSLTSVGMWVTFNIYNTVVGVYINIMKTTLIFRI